MHDTDRTQLEASLEQEHGPGPANGASPAGEAAALEAPLGELAEVELASELLEVSSEQELEQFLDGLLTRVGTAVGSFVRSDTGQALKAIVRGAARKALPVVGRGVGQWISPDRGGDLGASAANLAGQILGLELEGLSHEDREFEIAKQLIRFAVAAARYAARAPADLPPLVAARRAAAAAARRYAPGLLRRLPGRSSLAWPRSGRWFRRGRTIVLFGG